MVLAKGTSIEGGIKGSWLDGRLYATVALFKAKQRGLATYVGTVHGTDGPLGVDYYEGAEAADLKSCLIIEAYSFYLVAKVIDAA